ncbi:hypothetical protein A8M77_14450 [Variovorax sp. JS1663]|nr:hypothetical protein A8M77_14450 [Variovorax sp. JS1663]
MLPVGAIATDQPPVGVLMAGVGDVFGCEHSSTTTATVLFAVTPVIDLAPPVTPSRKNCALF